VIPTLLWRCPLCATNDALRHSQPRLRPEVVDCTTCGAQWWVRRVVGDNYYLKIIHSGGRAAAYPPGFEQTITAWYDLMKETVHLEVLPEPQNLLEAGERLYLASNQATLRVEAQPVFLVATPPAIPVTAPGGQGHLFLTSQRMIWQQFITVEGLAAFSTQPKMFSFPLRQVNGVHAILGLGLSVVVGMQQYTLIFANESPLKWVTYVALCAPQMKVESGHCIRTSHY
jgi:hypothetical protein